MPRKSATLGTESPKMEPKLIQPRWQPGGTWSLKRIRNTPHSLPVQRIGLRQCFGTEPLSSFNTQETPERVAHEAWCKWIHQDKGEPETILAMTRDCQRKPVNSGEGTDLRRRKSRNHMQCNYILTPTKNCIKIWIG